WGAKPRSGYRLLYRYFYRPGSAHRCRHCWPRLRPGRRPRSNRRSARRAHGTGERGAAAKRHQERLRKALRYLPSALGIITLLVTASGVFGEMQSTLNAIWKADPKGGTLSRLLRARAASL